MNVLTETITPTRNFNLLYIILDSVFVIVLLTLLFIKKRKVTGFFSIAGGILYFLVDFGYFYLLSHTRTVSVNGEVCNAGMTALVLLWMSLSYGITNFAFIWLCLRKDEYVKEFLFMIVGWWLIAPSISSLGGEATIQTYRTTGAYHGIMGIILVLGYLYLIIRNLWTKDKSKRANLIKLNLIGFFVQFGWEFALLINGIRPMNENSIQTLIIDSCLETNLGMPYFYLICLYLYRFIDEEGHKISKSEKIMVN